MVSKHSCIHSFINHINIQNNTSNKSNLNLENIISLEDDPVRGLQVLPQLEVHLEHGAALNALVVCSFVDEFVPQQVPSLLELLPAALALVRPFVVVNFHVHVQCVLSRERLLAHGADEPLVARVLGQVRQEVAALLELLEADVALEHVVVNQLDVRFQRVQVQNTTIVNKQLTLPYQITS
ncbi:Hypothetical_protein [Hexamita inflata]|uniref:Hypothetical_protein n=1 Tax=Hexamita inflata TaxID=28002 RepID=A0ABP1I9X8_9EUKA